MKNVYVINYYLKVSDLQLLRTLSVRVLGLFYLDMISKTTAVLTPDNIRRDFRRHTARLQSRDDQTSFKLSTARVSIGVKVCHLHDNNSVPASIQLF